MGGVVLLFLFVFFCGMVVGHLFFGVLYLSIFGVSVCGAPGLAFVGLGARVCRWVLWRA